MKNTDEFVKSALRNLGFESLNELQTETLEKSNLHPNLLVLSKTGSGKTLAFLLPLIAQLENIKKTQALIVVPSRELALQIEQVFKAIKSSFKVTVCYGGHSMRVEQNSLVEQPAVIIGTPGRICDHLDRGHLELNEVSHFIVDEYDKCLEFGFEDQMRFIHEHLKNLQKTWLISATEHKDFPRFIRFDAPCVINYLNQSEDPNIEFLKIPVNNSNKFENLYQALCSFEGALTIVFCNYREATTSITEFLASKGYEAVSYHGGMEQEERERALMKFRNGSFHTLVCTDLGSRGLDIPEIQHVVHFQYPHNLEAFIHRNGRTARMKSDGKSYLMINQDEETPEYLELPNKSYTIQGTYFPTLSPWVTLYFSGGKKDKINKVDIVGFLGKQAGLEKHEIGLITTMDFATYVAIPREKSRSILSSIRDVKVKGKKLKIAISK